MVPSDRAEETVAITAERAPQPGTQPFPQGEAVDDSPLPNSPIRDSVIIVRDAQLLGDLPQAYAMATPRSSVSRCATA